MLDHHRARRGAIRPGELTRARSGAPAARNLEYAVFHLVATEQGPGGAERVCEIAVLRMRGDGTVTREFTTFLDPRVPLRGQRFHAVTEADTLGAPRAADTVAELTRILSGAVVTSHGLDTTHRFLDAEFLPAGLPAGMPGLCTLRTLRAQLDLANHSLARASHTLTGHWPTAQHTALGQARACAQLLAELLDNAPGEFRYTGPAPVSLEPRATGRGAPAVRTKTRNLPQNPRVPAHRETPARPLAAWPHHWRRRELDPELCSGGFTTAERDAAVAEAERRGRRTEATAAALATTGALAAVGTATAVGRLLRRLR
ncbi:DNA polymerase-3 subunit epsilon [Haloactinospora alba]|uniref:DNA polymerase-3 subunit epsilon n=1 Tax=Haloactinospora alba TaxID=405555 RepID=A0A543NFN0_9ACTN|nr:3'-5' exonuclease [Haloactinospora alba]TQN30642.1 DNA polymerase-3 subunit epsilon [Haloactinospora alba]